MTDRKSAEAREKSLARRLADVLESTTDCVFVLDREWRFSFMNRRAVQEVAGGRDLIGLNIWEEYPHAVGSTFWDNYRRVMDERQPVTFEAYYPPPLDAWYEVHAYPSEQGIAVFFRNITADRLAREALRSSEQRLRQSEARFRDFANIASDWFWETDDRHRFTSLLGLVEMLPDPEPLGKTRWEVTKADAGEAPWKQHIAALGARKPFRDFEHQTTSRGGRPLWISSSGHPIFADDGTFVGYRGVSTNITHRKRSEAEREELLEQLGRAQRMQAVGQLAGGIAHDFNNLLTIILVNAELLAEEILDPRHRELAAMIQAAAERGSDLNQKLLAFSRRQSLKPQPVHLADVVRDLSGLLDRVLGEAIELNVPAREIRAAAVADRTQLESALLNLAINARDAMPTGGVLTIETDEVASPSGDVEFVSVTVADTGCGMAPEVLKCAFEPFFTTKEVGKGSGLGLSMVHGFIEQSGGHVSMKSELGHGTSVTILLPAVPAQPKANPVRPSPGETSRFGAAVKVLVVEDEADVRRHATSSLHSLGYSVLEAPDGPSGLDLLKQDPGVDILFTDLVLPKGMSGVELARQARTLKPDLKVLLTSGYSEDVFQQHGRPEEGTRLLRKPYRRKELAEALRSALKDHA